MKTSQKFNGSKGFTLVEIMIVVAIIGLLAAIAIPNFVKARKTSQLNACLSNLRIIDGAIQQWAMENGKSGVDTVLEADIVPYLGRGELGSVDNVRCPVAKVKNTFAGSYTITKVDTAPVCVSYDVNEHPAVLN